MDLNEGPSDHMVIDPKLEENNVGNYDFNGVEQRCKEVEIKCLSLEIGNQDMKFEGIREKIRVLEGEMVGVEEQIKGLRKKKADLEGKEIDEEMGGGFLLEDKNVDLESDELSKFDQLVIENKVLECEKSVALKEVDDWKRKCAELELRVRELEERLMFQCKDGDLIGMRKASKDGNDVSASRTIGVASCSPFAMNGGINTEEGSLSMSSHVKRRLSFYDERRFDEKIAPCTPAGAMPSSVAVIDIDSDNEADVPTKPELCIETEVTVMPGVESIEMDDGLDEEDEIGRTGKNSTARLKRKRDVRVVTSDDELGDDEAMPIKRACRIDNSVSESDEDDDTLPIKQIFGRVQSNCKSDDDDDDNIPISQLRMTRSQHSIQPAKLPVGTCCGQDSDDLSDSLTRPRRYLLKSGQNTQRGRVQKMEISPGHLKKKYVEDDEIVEDNTVSVGTSSGQESDDLSDIITRPRRRLVKSGQNTQRGTIQKKRRPPGHLKKKYVENDEIVEDDTVSVGTSSGQEADDLSDSITRPRRRLVKSGQSTQSAGVQKIKKVPGRVKNKYVEDDESDKDESSSDASLDDFIVSDSDVENIEDDLSEDGSHPSQELEETSDNDLDYKKIMSSFQSRRDPHSSWNLLGEMQSDFGKDPELCMRAVCALCRRQTIDEQLFKDSIVQNGRGFSKFDALRGTYLGEFLTGGDPNGAVVKTVEELKEYDPQGPETCYELAMKYSKQLFEIYENDESPFFP